MKIHFLSFFLLKCIFTVHPRAHRQLYTIFSQPLSSSQLRCSCTCRCPRSVFYQNAAGSCVSRSRSGLTESSFCGSGFFLLDWRSKVTASSSALALHYHEASECLVPHHLDHSEERNCRKVWSSWGVQLTPVGSLLCFLPDLGPVHFKTPSSEQIGGFIMPLSLQVTQSHQVFLSFILFLGKENVSDKQRLLNVTRAHPSLTCCIM